MSTDSGTAIGAGSDSNVGRLIAAIERELDSFAGTGGVAAKNLDTGEEIRVNADDVVATASTIKVPILIELFRRVEAGDISLEQRLVLTDEIRTEGSGILRELSSGVELSVLDHATLMIVVSDNTSTNLLIDLLGRERINQTSAEIGFPRTRLHERFDFPKVGQEARNLSVTTPADLAGFMEVLATGSILEEKSRETILDMLRRQHYTDLVPRYLPFFPHPEELGHPDNGLRIANKTGGWTGMRADMALVEWPGTRYVVGIVTEGDPDLRFWAENSGSQVIGRISRLIFDYFGGDALYDPARQPAAKTATSGS